MRNSGAGRANAYEGVAALYGAVRGLALFVVATVIGTVRAGGVLVVAGSSAVLLHEGAGAATDQVRPYPGPPRGLAR